MTTRNDLCRKFKIELDASGRPDPKCWANALKLLVESMSPVQDASLPEEVKQALFLRNASRIMETVQTKRSTAAPLRLLGPESDLFYASSKRIEWIIGCLWGFGAFREEYIEKMEHLDTESTNLCMENTELEQENAYLQEQLEAARLEKARLDPEVDALVASNEELRRKIQALNEKQAQLKAQKEELDAEKQIIREETESCREKNRNIAEQIKKLRKQLIDPAESKQELETQQRVIEWEKRKIDTLKADAKLIGQRTAAFSRVAKRVSKASDELGSAKTRAEKAKESEKKLVDTRAELGRSTEQLQETERKALTAKEVHQHMQESLQNLETSRSETLARLQEELRLKEAALRDAHARATSTQCQIAQNERVVQETKAQIARLEQRHRLDVEKLHQNYQTLVAQARVYHQTLLRHMTDATL